jgi:hypothetical protein
VILGKTGTGKSRLLAYLLTGTRSLILVDTMLEHGALAVPVDAHELYRRVLAGGPYRLALCPADVDTVDWCSRLAASQPGVTYVIDEYSYWYPSATCSPGPGLLALARCGRKLGQRLFLTTQSPGAITKQLVGQSDLWVLPMDEVNDRRYVVDRTSGAIDPGSLRILETDAQGRNLRIQVARLSRGRRFDYILETPGPMLRQSPSSPQVVPNLSPENPQKELDESTRAGA